MLIAAGKGELECVQELLFAEAPINLVDNVSTNAFFVVRVKSRGNVLKFYLIAIASLLIKFIFNFFILFCSVLFPLLRHISYL